MGEITAMVSLVYADWRKHASDAPDEFYRAMIQLVETGRVLAALDDSTGEVVYWSAITGG